MPSSLSEAADHVDRLRVPGAVRGEAGDLGVVDLLDDARPHVERALLRFHGEVPVRPHEGDGLEPAAQEAPQHVRPLLDHVVGGEDHVGVEMLHDVAEQDQVAGAARLLELVAVRRLQHHAVELAAVHGGEPRLHLAERRDPDPGRAPALLPRQFADQPIRQRAGSGDADALALEVGHAPDRRFRRNQQREIGGCPVHGRDADRRRALDAEAEPRARAEPDIETAGGQRLLHLRIAAEARDRDVEPFAREDLGLDADLGRGEGERVGHRLADAHGVEGKRGVHPRDQQCGAQ